MRGGGPLPQHSVSLLRDIFNLHARHGAIMALEAPLRNRAIMGMTACREPHRALLSVPRAHRSFAGLILTEVNPTRDADGSQINRYLDGVIELLAS
jgi:hypothetical protein